ncbi:MAG TPA: hypothetical protein VMU62_05180 [Acidobacteriaceae bacterium]|nr:hypothetical protein [Acidobacteriaceae bacterium]
MMHTPPNAGVPSAETNDATFFGIPVGRFGFFSSLLLSAATGFMAFFLTTFCSIFGVMLYDGIHHLSLQNLNISYKFIAAPVGLTALLFSLAYLLSLWVRRKLAGQN